MERRSVLLESTPPAFPMIWNDEPKYPDPKELVEYTPPLPEPDIFNP